MHFSTKKEKILQFSPSYYLILNILLLYSNAFYYFSVTIDNR